MSTECLEGEHGVLGRDEHGLLGREVRRGVFRREKYILGLEKGTVPSRHWQILTLKSGEQTPFRNLRQQDGNGVVRDAVWIGEGWSNIS